MLRSLGDDLAALIDRLTRLDRHSPVRWAPPPLTTRYPALVYLSADLLARVTCPICFGDGVRAGDADLLWPCVGCAGSGLACPTCRGNRWLRTTTPAERISRVEDAISRCPECASPAAETATLRDFIAEHAYSEAGAG